MVDWDIPAYRSLTSLKFGRTLIVWQVNNRQELSEDVSGIIMSIQQQVMKIQPFSQGFRLDTANGHGNNLFTDRHYHYHIVSER
jgi:diadenosine tetraphosphate (Ap4A) HIT family hydrolase